ncbi:MAG: ABC transporter substrate-binding protein [Clostridia bacterium]|nr:ABC transporter substrate-binding protein [Clostridia bacterium]
MKKRVKTITTSVVCVLLALAFIPLFSGCSSKKSSIVIMSEELSGLFNPFYATTGADQEVVGMTQIGMLSTDSEGELICGEDEATVVLAYDYVTPEEDTSLTESTYRFVIKNDLYFSDGTPLTINDVIFNMYEYLDPVYTGSSTMYSTEIVGLDAYRTQQNYSGSTDDTLDEEAASYARTRIDELIDVYHETGRTGGSGSTSYYATEDMMREAISTWNVTDGYYLAVGIDRTETGALSEARAKLLSDYEFSLETFSEELDEDYISAKEAFDVTAAPYNSNAELMAKLESDVFKFMMYEGYVSITYAKGSDGKDDPSVIEKFDINYRESDIDTEEKAKNKVYKDNVEESFDTVLSYWGTATTLATEYAAEYKSIQLQSRTNEDGSLIYPYIEGIASLGHKRVTEENAEGAYLSSEYVTVDGKQYKVARNHNEDGTPADEGTYDILEVRVNGTDPKAIYNFSFSVAPVNYYSGEKVDIENNEFGVKYADYDFQSNTIQSELHNGVPVGAGPFKATNRSNDDTGITRQNFWNSGNVYFKKNDNFMFDVKSENIVFQEVSSTNAIDKLKKGEIDYAEPQFTATNYDTLTKDLKGKVGVLEANQLGYGYIGINAGKVKNVYLRRAIMSAMETSLATEYYSVGTSQTIYWPMSIESWAYPITGYDEKGHKIQKTDNGHDYAGQWSGTDNAVTRIQNYMQLAANNYGGYTTSDLKLTFTISGSSISDHPTYRVFLQAMELLNSCGWNVEVRADTQALTKLATGSLSVWAAAWGSTIDPDMYQVYHYNSTASSTYAWGYREIKADPTGYSYEYNLIKNTLSPVIDRARETAVKADRTELYEEAMGYVLDLAIELPVYQRENLYAYNIKTLGGLNENVNPYSSPLEKIWEIYLIK